MYLANQTLLHKKLENFGLLIVMGVRLLLGALST